MQLPVATVARGSRQRSLDAGAAVATGVPRHVESGRVICRSWRTPSRWRGGLRPTTGSSPVADLPHLVSARWSTGDHRATGLRGRGSGRTCASTMRIVSRPRGGGAAGGQRLDGIAARCLEGDRPLFPEWLAEPCRPRTMVIWRWPSRGAAVGVDRDLGCRRPPGIGWPTGGVTVHRCRSRIRRRSRGPGVPSIDGALVSAPGPIPDVCSTKRPSPGRRRGGRLLQQSLDPRAMS